jgi:hypothetical protein
MTIYSMAMEHWKKSRPILQMISLQLDMSRHISHYAIAMLDYQGGNEENTLKP